MGGEGTHEGGMWGQGLAQPQLLLPYLRPPFHVWEVWVCLGDRGGSRGCCLGPGAKWPGTFLGLIPV